MIDTARTIIFGRPPGFSPANVDARQRLCEPILDTIRLVLDVPSASLVFAPTPLGHDDGVSPLLAAFSAEAIASPVPIFKNLSETAPDAGGLVPAGALLGAPIVTARGERCAVIAADDRPRAFAERDGVILNHFARCIASKLDLSDRAETDDLTGLTRRAPFIDELRTLFQTRQRTTGAVLAIIDLDHFKRINDEHGHPIGDIALGTVAEALRRILGRDGILCRLGGEEFAVVFPGHSLNQVMALLDHTRRAIAGLAIPGVEGLRITASFGVAPLFPEVVNVSAWLKAADSALYAAKQGGRNQIRVGYNSVPAKGTAADPVSLPWSAVAAMG
ncbi:GGDEF domain-containing protein [Acuticoccus yangtzensis]|uniref:GGDEF domain-containing protein n=1 Tax=Acuticoccus yangtzensis TaxID=1443441 RepID=UPI000949AEB0|nr:GGDEF domain-containing protein [Acuticoccus yangtzensis]